jgi:pantetheine-phosphate adenylyltransferase
MKALYAGSFEPITNGHIDIIRQAVKLFDKVIIGIAQNAKKKNKYILSPEQRGSLVYASLEEHNLIDSCQVKHYDGLTTIAADVFKADILVRGLRAVSDFDVEFQMTQLNRKLHKGCNTVFLMPDAKNFYLSSSAVRDIYNHGGDISVKKGFVVIDAKTPK